MVKTTNQICYSDISIGWLQLTGATRVAIFRDFPSSGDFLLGKHKPWMRTPRGTNLICAMGQDYRDEDIHDKDSKIDMDDHDIP